MSFFRRIFRILRVAAVFGYAVIEVLIKRPKTRAARAAWLCSLGKRLMWSVDVTLSTHGPIPKQGAIISNHLAYLDILTQAAVQPCVFVSKIELRSTPVMGWISMMAGTVYVARGAGGSALKAAAGMAQGFADGLPVVFFPEGTTGVGDVPLLPFRSGLLAQAIAAEAPVTASFVRYELTPYDLARGKTVRNDVHWGDQTLWEHIWNFVDLHGVHATIQFAPGPIVFSPAAIENRKIAGVEAAAAVLAVSQMPGA